MPRKFLLASGALAAGLTLTACGSGGGPASSASSAPPQSCLQQYRSWNAGPSHAAGENLVAALNGLEAVTVTSDANGTGAALKRAATAAASLGHYPIPACADPKGYWRAVLVRIQAAAKAGGTPNGQGTVAAAKAALKDMPALDLKLADELRQTIPGLYKKN
jgi:hypothetical protein